MPSKIQNLRIAADLEERILPFEQHTIWASSAFPRIEEVAYCYSVCFWCVEGSEAKWVITGGRKIKEIHGSL